MVDHLEFTEKLNSGKIEVAVHKDLPTLATAAGFFPLIYGYTQIFWTLCLVLGLIAAIPVMIWYIWWVGLIILLISFALPRALRETEERWVLVQLRKNQRFYEFAQENNLIVIRVKKSEVI